jgi:hypothetical protein
MNRTCNHPGQPCPPAVQAEPYRPPGLFHAIVAAMILLLSVVVSGLLLISIVLSLLFVVGELA